MRMPSLAALPLLTFLPSLSAQVFAPAQSQPMPAGIQPAVDLVVGDLDPDGAVDVVVLDRWLFFGSLWVLRGNGAGGFVAVQTRVGEVVGPQDMTLADANGDGRLDLFAASVPQATQLRADGAGGFVASALPTGGNLCVGDFDGDGHPDLFGGLGADFGWLRNDGTGGFGPFTPVASLTGVGPAGFRVGDVDGDGDRDVLVAWTASGHSFLARNDGSGGFTVEPLGLPYLLSSVFFNVPGTCELFDFDGDGLPDVISRGQVSGISLHRNLGNGTFAATSSWTALDVTDIAPGDVDGDGNVDLVVADGTGIKLMRGDGTGAFVLAQSQAVAANGRLALADVDADGDLDVVAVGGSSFHVLKNQQVVPSGLAAFGSGTATCRGRIGIRALTPPTIGNQAFTVLCSNTPTDASGLLAMGTKVAGGWDPLGIDLVLHLGLALPVGTMQSDSGGAARARLPIPPIPFLTGLTVHLQSFWVADIGAGDTCSPAWSELASSRGLSVTLHW